jgi:triphosphoribosyl-dephospho-CoA synthase
VAFTRSSAADVAAGAQLACVLEVSAEKPGNITPTHDFHDTSYEEMVRSAIAIGPELARAEGRGVGATVLGVVEASRRASRANTNLGIALLLAPLARAALGPPAGGVSLRAGLRAVLASLDLEDARAAYAAIRLAGAGGLGEAAREDVRAEPTVGLREAMAQAADRDRVAAEYVSDFALTFETGLPALGAALDAGLRPRDAVVELFLVLLDDRPDTLIARKRGARAAAEVSAQASRVLAAGGPRTEAGRRGLDELAAALRDPRNELNPGTTADLVAATLFVAVLGGRL